MRLIEEKIEITCSLLRQIADKPLFRVDSLEYVPSGYKQGNTPPETGWQPFRPGMRVQGRNQHFWFRTRFHTPAAKAGVSYFAKCTTGLEEEWDAANPQGIIYLNGEMSQACDGNHTEIYLKADTEYVLHNYFYTGMQDRAVPLELCLFERDAQADHLYYDMKVPLDCCRLLHPDSDEWIGIMDALEQTANRIDFRVPGSEACRMSIRKAQDYLEEHLYRQQCSTEGKPVVDCIGHTHIDVEWMWHRSQTREKIQRSFANAAALMKQYPEYRFMLSQPELYRYLREEAPEKYRELCSLVREGRWEPEGAMWVEADCNLISGESFVRQIMQGTRFFREEFGTECRVLFLPDVFGYSCALPQILKKSGIRHFVTSKISWNETNTLPMDSFLWQGLDGSEIFTNFITTQEYTGMEPKRYTTYVGTLTPSQIKGTWVRFQQKAYGRCAFTTFGHGDGGGGPTRTMLETQRRLARGIPGMPVTRMEGLLTHLDQARQEFDEGCMRTGRTPRWVGELYLEHHRGTYTSMAKNKRNNRKAEFLLQKTEALSYADLLFGGSYDADGIYSAWNQVLHNQFHDILPGSSIREVYEETDRDYARIGAYCEGQITQKLQTLTARMNTRGGLLICNPLGFARGGPVAVCGQTREIGEEIPAFGWKVIPDKAPCCGVAVEGLTVENRYYRMTLDRAGRIEKLYDRENGRQVLLDGCTGNELQVFEDYPMQHDNWEIPAYYRDKMWILDDDAQISPIADGSRRGFRVVRQYLRSEIRQNIWLYTASRRIDFETEIDWHEHHQILKTAFPLDVHATEAVCEVQYGHIRRPTHCNTSWEQAKFEVYGHKWVDLGENGYGVSLLNDCKYGFSAQGSTLKLTMLKCGTYPNPEADQGLHRFTYSLLPHAGDFREAGVIREAYALNQPLSADVIPASAGPVPDCFGLACCDRENLIPETVKKAEADDGMILRLYDAFDRRTEATVTVPGCFTRAFLCDLMEHPLQELPVRNGRVRIQTGNFEIVTLKFTRA